MTNPYEANISILVDNCVGRPRMRAEHGLSILIDYGNCRILFDTGEGQSLTHNAKIAGVDLAAVDHIVISHGHDDHTGGLTAAIEQAPKARVWLHPGAYHSRYARSPSEDRVESIGMSAPVKAILENHQYVTHTPFPTEVIRGFWVTGTIPRPERGVPTHSLFIDSDAQEPDEVIDDQSVYFETRAGLVVILGCAHAGLMNTLNHISRLTRERRIAAVIGGTHLYESDDSQLREAAHQLRSVGLNLLVPTHCTGPRALLVLAAELGSIVQPGFTGWRGSFDIR